MNPQNPYWTVPAMFKAHKGLQGYQNNLGFFFKTPVADIQTSGYYWGDNPGYGRRELVMAGGERPQYYAVDGTLPGSGGVPKYDPKSPYYKVKRSAFTKKLVGI